MTHLTYREQRERMSTARSDWYMIAFVVLAYALLMWSAIESLSQADSERAMRAARDDPMIVHQGNTKRD